MAMGWMTVLKLVPWGDVINNAPKVAEGARKLWSSSATKPVPPEGATAAMSPGSMSDAQALVMLQARLLATEATVAELHQQMLASSQLISDLADQNAALIKRVEANRIRTWCLFVATVMLSALLAGHLWGWLPHH